MTASRYSHDPTAVVGRRFGAYVIDMLLLLSIVPIVIFFSTAGLTEYTSGPSCSALEQAGEIDSGQFCIRNVSTSNTDANVDYSTMTFNKSAVFLAVAVHAGYLIIIMWILQGLTGMTLGKALFGIRTVDQEGGPPGIGRQLVRGLLWIIDGIAICGFPLIAILTILLTRGHRRLGDMVANTYVVAGSDAGTPVVVPGAGGAMPPAAPIYVAPTQPGTTAPGAASGPGASAAAPPAGGAIAPEPGPTADPSAPSGTEAGGPRWDPARNAYVYWDPSRSAWLVHDAATGEWKPLT